MIQVFLNCDKHDVLYAKCGVARRKDVGFCKATDKTIVASFGPHFGEEDVILCQIFWKLFIWQLVRCGGYERIETLKILDGIVDIYMPDFKYMMRLQGDFVLYQPGKNGPLSN